MQQYYLEVSLDPHGKVDLKIVHGHANTKAELGLRAHLDAKVTRGDPSQMGSQLHVPLAAIN
jgi:hypothetical protein